MLMFSQNRRRLSRVIEILRDEGIAGVYQRFQIRGHSPATNLSVGNPTAGVEYPEWLKKVEAKRAPTPSPSKHMFSIVMPLYKPDLEFLAAAIDSILTQSYQHWELCMHDDGSGDPKLTKLIHDARNNDPRIKLSQASKNSGIAVASNHAASLAAGDFIVLMDQDDLLSVVALESLALAIDTTPSLRLIYSDEDKIDVDGNYS